MVSLEKKLKSDPWYVEEINDYYEETDAPKDVGEWLVLEETLIELKKVAQQIREIFEEEEYRQFTKQDYERLKSSVVGLLVEQEEK